MVGLADCPSAINDPKINLKNHLDAIEYRGLGPADPTQPNDAFWLEKARKFGVLPGDARGRLCANCRYYVNTTFIKECIMSTDTRNVKA